jgi:hypothetical protein
MPYGLFVMVLIAQLAQRPAVFSPSALLCESAPLTGGIVPTNWVNSRRGKVIFVNSFELLTISQDGTRRAWHLRFFTVFF